MIKVRGRGNTHVARGPWGPTGWRARRSVGPPAPTPAPVAPAAPPPTAAAAARRPPRRASPKCFSQLNFTLLSIFQVRVYCIIRTTQVTQVVSQCFRGSSVSKFSWKKHSVTQSERPCLAAHLRHALGLDGFHLRILVRRDGGGWKRTTRQS